MTQINDADIENLRHMLGIGSHIKKRQWGYRNHFAPGGTDIWSGITGDGHESCC